MIAGLCVRTPRESPPVKETGDLDSPTLRDLRRAEWTTRVWGRGPLSRSSPTLHQPPCPSSYSPSWAPPPPLGKPGPRGVSADVPNTHLHTPARAKAKGMLCQRQTHTQHSCALFPSPLPPSPPQACSPLSPAEAWHASWRLLGPFLRWVVVCKARSGVCHTHLLHVITHVIHTTQPPDDIPHTLQNMSHIHHTHHVPCTSVTHCMIEHHSSRGSLRTPQRQARGHL